MATKIKVTKKKRSRRRRVGGNSGYIQCNMCHGTGRIRDWHRSSGSNK